MTIAHKTCISSISNQIIFLNCYEKTLTLEEAIRRLSSLPAENLKIKRRGALKPGYFADIVIFNPEKVSDMATFEKPHQYATGVAHVWVNGVQVILNGTHTGATPGRFIKGPGWEVRDKD